MRLKNIPKQVLFLGLISFFTDFASEMLYPVVPLFLTAVLGASMTMVGVIEGVAEITAGILKGVFGGISDKVGKRSLFVRLGYSVSALVKPLPGLLPFVGTVFFTRVADRIGKGIRTAPRDALLAANAKGNSGAVFGLHRSMDTLGAVVGPLVAVAILYFLPNRYDIIFLSVFIPGLFAVYFTFLIKDPPEILTRKDEHGYSVKEFWEQASSEYKYILVLITAFYFVNSSDVFLILKSNKDMDSNLLALSAYILYNLVYAFTSYPGGKLADRIGKRKVFSWGLLLFSLVYLGFAFNESSSFVWVLFAVYGIYTAFTEGTSKAWISDLTDERYTATAIGLFTMLSSFAMLIGSVLTGALWDAFGPEIPFLLSSFVSFIVAVLFLTKFKSPQAS